MAGALALKAASISGSVTDRTFAGVAERTAAATSAVGTNVGDAEKPIIRFPGNTATIVGGTSAGRTSSSAINTEQ
jgi:hypothetical protein